jgi:tetratricopeptide (TPR) repeat protein
MSQPTASAQGSCFTILTLLACVGSAALAITPARGDGVAALCDRALALKRARDLVGAAGAYQEAIALDPRSIQAHWGLAWVLASGGRRDEAIREFQQVLRLAEDDDIASEARAALKRLGASPAEPQHDLTPPAPTPPPAVPATVAGARELLAAGQALGAVRVLRAVLADEPENQEALALLSQAKTGRRTVLVRAAAGPVFRSQPKWEDRLRSRLAAAAKHISRQVEIDLALLAVEPWDRQGTTADGLDLVAELQNEVPPVGADVVIGFVAQEREAQSVGDRVEVRGYTLGIAPCLTGYGIVSDVIASRDGKQYRVPEAKLLENLIHEVGHLFGAVHVTGNSVMRPSPGGPAVYEFDALNLEVMRTCRWVEFEENLASLSADELERMADIYARIVAGPGADDGVHFYRAAVLSTPPLERYEEAIEEYKQVLAASSQDPFAHFNIAELYSQTGHLEQARAHWKIAAFIGKPATVAAQAQAALDRTNNPQQD